MLFQFCRLSCQLKVQRIFVSCCTYNSTPGNINLHAQRYRTHFFCDVIYSDFKLQYSSPLSLTSVEESKEKLKWLHWEDSYWLLLILYKLYLKIWYYLYYKYLKYRIASRARWGMGNGSRLGLQWERAGRPFILIKRYCKWMKQYLSE